MENVILSQFVANYDKNIRAEYYKRKITRIIRYHYYNMAVYILFKSENNDVLAENKFIQIYEDKKTLDIDTQRIKLISNLDIQKTLEICR